jgi:perosamine synthetase
VPHAIAVSNGTTALQAALWASGVGEGDEVLVPAFTFAASANAVIAVGATPVFVDVGQDLLIDLDDALRRLTDKTKAVMAVHLDGLMADMEAVSFMAGNRDLVVIEDAAQAHLARRNGRLAGSVGVGAFSFYATKNMTCGEGGMITTHDDTVASSARKLRNHGMVNRYEHEEWGLNLRLTELAAAIARVQLGKLKAGNARRRENASYYDQNLSDAYQRIPVPGGAHHVYHQYVVRVDADRRDTWLQALQSRGVGADVYYPTPVNRQPAFEHLGQSDGCPNALAASREVLALPVHPLVGHTDRRRVVEVANEIAGEAP